MRKEKEPTMGNTTAVRWQEGMESPDDWPQAQILEDTPSGERYGPQHVFIVATYWWDDNSGRGCMTNYATAAIPGDVDEERLIILPTDHLDFNYKD